MTAAVDKAIRGSSLEEFLRRLPAAPGTDRSLWIDARGRVSGRYYGSSLSSTFEPVVDAAHGRPVAFEALVRSYDPAGQGLSPWRLFELAASDEQLIGLDRLCRTVHAINFFANDPGGQDLHLNVHGRLLSAVPDDHGSAFRRVLASLGIATERIVIELPPAVAGNDTLLAFLVANYRSNGFRVAVALSSSDHLVALVRRVRPDLVKVPLGKVLEQGLDVHDLARQARETGTRMVVTEVEDKRLLPEVLAPDTLLAQGLAWGRSRPVPEARAGGEPLPAFHVSPDR